MIHDVSEADFQRAVIERSSEVPVVVDFWAEWCGPCRQLGPALEAEAAKRGDDVDLAKIDVDSNQGLSQQFGVQGIPAVKAFRDGKVVNEFTGAIPPAQVAAFFNGLVPSESDRLATSGDEADLRKALEMDPRSTKAAIGLAKILLGRGEHQEALDLLAPHEADFVAAGLRARAELLPTGEIEGLEGALEQLDSGGTGAGLERLQELVAAEADADRKVLLRKLMVGIFNELGTGHELSREHRRRLAIALS